VTFNSSQNMTTIQRVIIICRQNADTKLKYSIDEIVLLGYLLYSVKVFDFLSTCWYFVGKLFLVDQKNFNQISYNMKKKAKVSRSG